MKKLIHNFKLDAIENKPEINIPYDINSEIINIKPKSKNIENSKIIKELTIFDNPNSEKFNLSNKDQVFNENYYYFMEKADIYEYFYKYNYLDYIAPRLNDKIALENIVIQDIFKSEHKFLYRFVCKFYNINEFRLQIGIKNVINFNSYLISSNKNIKRLLFFKNFDNVIQKEKFIALYHYLLKGL